MPEPVPAAAADALAWSVQALNALAAEPRNEAELRVAHARSSRYASTLLLEKHVPGDD